MELVALITTDGNPVFVNPAHVKAVVSIDGEVKIVTSGDSWAINVGGPIDEVVAAMESRCCP